MGNRLRLFFFRRNEGVWIIMPKTTGQKVLFGLLMSFFMVLAMELYNTGLRNGGLTNAGILEVLRELPLMFVLCFLTSTAGGAPGVASGRRPGPVRHDGLRHVPGHEPLGHCALPAARR